MLPYSCFVSTLQAIYADVSLSRKTTGAGRYRDRNFFVNPGVLHAPGAAPALQPHNSAPLPGDNVDIGEDSSSLPGWMVVCRTCEAKGVPLEAQLRAAAEAAVARDSGQGGGCGCDDEAAGLGSVPRVEYHHHFHVHNVPPEGGVGETSARSSFVLARSRP